MNTDLKRMLFKMARGLAVGQLMAAFKRRAGLAFANIVDGVRRSLLLVVLINLMLNLLVLSFGGTVVTATLLWGGDDKLYWLFGLCAGFLVLATTGVAFLMSRHTWFRVAGITPDALDEAAG